MQKCYSAEEGREGASWLILPGSGWHFQGTAPSLPSLPPTPCDYIQPRRHKPHCEPSQCHQSITPKHIYVCGPHSQILVSSLCIQNKLQSESHCNGFSLAFPGPGLHWSLLTAMEGTYFCIGPTDHYIKLTFDLPKIPTVPCCRVCPLMSYKLITSTMH